MQCLNDVRECVGYDACVCGTVRRVEYVGWSNGLNEGPSNGYAIQYCDYSELNQIVVGGKVVYAAPILTRHTEDAFADMIDHLERGSREVIHLIHGQREADPLDVPFYNP